MKYESTSGAVPVAERAEINHRIVNLILSGNTRELRPADVYTRFTGKGALHGLQFNDFTSYHGFAEAKKQVEQGQFFTPDDLCGQIVAAIRPPDHFKIADITCGKGSFFNHLPVETNIYGNELDNDAFEVCRYLFPNANLENKDFLYYKPAVRIDLILGNPPFNFRTEEGVSQFAFVKKSRELLNYGGLLAFITPISFLADDFQDGQKISWVNKHFHFVLQSRLPKNSFDANIATKLLILQKKGIPNNATEYDPKCWTEFEPNHIYEQIISPLLTQYHACRVKLKRLQTVDKETDLDIHYRIKRRMWHIKENKSLKKRFYPRAQFKLRQLETQQKPAKMSDAEWEKAKLTPKKVLHYLETAIRNQNDRPPMRIIKLVKTSYGVKYKAYHPRLKRQESVLSIHEILLGDYDLGPFNRLFQRKKRALQLQNVYFTDLPNSPQVETFLDTVVLLPKPEPGLLFQREDIPTIKPNAMQKRDLGLLFQKPYDLLNWEQGGGKSVAGMLWIRYRQRSFRNCFIVGPALAIDTTWTDQLTRYGFDFITVSSISDIYRIRRGQIILLSNDSLVTLEKHIKQFIRRCSYKIALLDDESDERTNPFSQRSLAALNCFRKARYKLLTTGTTTRNNINELYTQLELLYNNSTAFLCHAPTRYHINKEGELVETKNPYYGRPFPAHHGSAVFKSCFCPVKTTVFGIQKENQDVFNEEALRELICKTIITRKFEEIVGEKKYSIHIHHLQQNNAEKNLYHLLMTEFMRVCYDFYTSTGNQRKEAGLRLVRQMMVLIKATSIPHKMKHYQGQSEPAKFHAIRDLIRQWPDETVIIGTTLKRTADCYLKYLAREFPNRQLFYIDGDQTPTARKKILAQLKASRNGLLCTTQQALKSSVNIPFCDKVIIETMQWNIPKIAQFYFRCIRFDSPRHTQVHFATYEDTIEVNLMALLMVKERLNDYIKTTNQSTTEEIYEEFGFDMGILDMLIQKNYDKDGKLYLTWGQQRIAA